MASVPAIDGYADLVQLAQGGFGVVYRAFQDRHDRVVALKVLNVDDLDERDRQRFERECRAMGRLSWHPNVVALFDSGITTDGHPWLAMEYLEAGSLGDRLKHGALPWQDAVCSGVQVAGALGAAHAAGTLHRDLKPENLLVGPFGETKLGDFGIAAVEGAARSTVGTASFTLSHAAPEVLRGERPDERADIYSLASTLHTIISATLPFAATRNEPLSSVVARVLHVPAPHLTGVPDDLADLLARGLAKDLHERPQTAADFGRELQRVEANHRQPVTELRLAPTASATPLAAPLPPPAPPPPPPPPPMTALPTPEAVVPPAAFASSTAPMGEPEPSTPKRGRLVAGLLALVVAVAIATVTLIVSRSGGGSQSALPTTTTSVVVTPPVATDTIEVGREPEQVAATDTDVWVANAGDGTVTHIDPVTNRAVDTIEVGSNPFGVAVTAADVWVTNADDGSVSRIDPSTARVTDTFDVGRSPGGLAATDDAVWVANAASDNVSRLDPTSGKTTARVAVGTSPISVAVDDTAVWVTNFRDDTVTRIDPSTNDIVDTIDVGRAPNGVAVTADAVWVANATDATLSRIDPATNEVTATIDVGTNPTDVAAGAGAVWVTNQGDGTLARVDTATNRVTDTIDVASTPNGVAATADTVWLTNFDLANVTRVDPGSP